MTLRQLGEWNGYRAGRPDKMLRIGVDLSEMIDTILTVSPHIPLLEAFFLELCTFLDNNVVVTFVRDSSGPDRHDKYRYAETSDQQHDKRGFPWWVQPCQELIQYFNFNFYCAPCEADAELAKLNSLGLVDVIIVRDADVFALGALCVLRRIRPPHTYAVYTADAIEHVDGVQLTRGGIFLYSLLKGNRYSNPINSISYETAFELARSGLGNDLVNVLDAHNTTGSLSSIPVTEVCAWINKFQVEIVSNQSGYLTSPMPELAARLPRSFPFHGISLYSRPMSSWAPPFTPPDSSLWIPREPVISKIAEFCSLHLGWTTALDLARKFATSLWTGVLLRLLALSDVVYEPNLKVFATPFHASTARQIEFYDHPTSGKPRARLRLSTIRLMSHFDMDLDALNHDENNHLTWVQITVPRHHLPAGVLPFEPVNVA
ncbi:PIN domain-like protein [Crepidotus variabilis]|uniref:PIN domain-like protein n=1 Tax=Crepidotus variabilis TaxID=179855 RepID=A0A9P6EAG7_9AGAR|nr:PIN domain-like protein [Crepidotus variabilis]